MAKGRPKDDRKGRIGGRAPGTPNKITAMTKAAIQNFLDENQEEAWKAWKEIKSPKQKFEMYLKLCEFVIPKMASVELKGEVKTPDWMAKLESLKKK